uniref:Galectin n=1 Tax=Peltigera membranacea TaxID=161997 RepID=L7UY64_9LECA|nr:lectin-2 [Peltigera membranacea]
MASQWIFLEPTVSVPKLKSTSLDKPFAPGQSITFVSTSFDPIADTTVNLDSAGFYFTKDGDVLLSISIRRHQNLIIFNSRQGGTWGHEKLIDLQGVFPGPRAITHVTANATKYNIAFNNSSNIHTFTKVIQGDPTGVLHFESNSKPVFSNPVITAVIEN